MKISILSRLKIRRIVECHFNCCDVGDIFITDENHLRIEIRSRHGNIVDSNALPALLAELKERGFVGERTKCMWLGFYRSKFYVWCTNANLI